MIKSSYNKNLIPFLSILIKFVIIKNQLLIIVFNYKILKNFFIFNQILIFLNHLFFIFIIFFLIINFANFHIKIIIHFDYLIFIFI
jgi:hypothetical protein